MLIELCSKEMSMSKGRARVISAERIYFQHELARRPSLVKILDSAMDDFFRFSPPDFRLMCVMNEPKEKDWVTPRSESNAA
jgi:hypothetical protein